MFGLNSTIIIIWLSIVGAVWSQLVIFEPSVVAGNYETAQILLPRNGTLSTPYNASLIYLNNPLVRSTWPDVTGKIVLTSLFIPPEALLRDMQQRGARAVIMEGFSGVPGFIQYASDNDGATDIFIDFVELEEGQYKSITASTKENATLDVFISFEPNPWQPVFESGWLYAAQVSLGAFEVLNIVFGVIRLRQFILRDEGLALNIPQISLASDLAANLIRIIAAVSLGGMPRLYNRNATLVFLLLSVPFTLTPSLLISFFWHEILESNRLDVNSGIKKLKVPFIVTCFCLFALEIVVDVIRCLPLGLTDVMLFVNGPVYAVIGLAIGIFFVVTAVRVVRRVRTSERLKDRYTAKTSLRIAFASLGLFLSAIAAGFATFMLQFPEGYLFDIWLGHIALNIVSLCNVLAFTVPPSFQSTSKKTNSVPPSATQLPTETV